MTQDLIRHYIDGNMDVIETLARVRSDLKRMRQDVETLQQFERLLSGASKPDPLNGITTKQTIFVQREIASRCNLRADAQSEKWAGHVVGAVLNINTKSEDGRKTIKQMISQWVKEDVLRIEVVRDRRQGRDVKTIVAGALVEAAQ
jgi:YesN/AraC family two-component response regulator